MNKQENKLALSVLTTLISGIALIYTLIMYHTIIFAVMGMSLIFLICAYILTQNIIAFNVAKNKDMNNQLKDYIQDISQQLETMNGTQAQLGKATFLYTKQAAQAVAMLENNYMESQDALYKNLASISSMQNKTTKLMIKYDQSNTTKVISTIKELRNQLSDTMIQGFDQIQPNNTEVIGALEDIVEYLKSQPVGPDQTLSLQLNNVAHELQNISNNIQHFQMTAQNVAPMAQVQAVAMQEPLVSEQEIPEQNMPQESTYEPAIEELVEENFTEETINADAITENVSLAEPVIEESILEESATNDSAMNETTMYEISKEEATTAEVIAEDTEIAKTGTADVAPVPDDPNKQLSADEIAALFAAAEPTPKKETAPVEEDILLEEEEKPFTPTFTVVGKSDEYIEEAKAEESKVATIDDLSDDPNKQLSADEIAALFAAADPAPKKEEKPAQPVAPVAEDPNKQLSADEIAALFAAAEPTPKKDTSDEEKAMDEAIAKAEPVNVAPVSDDPNKQLSADEIAALFASLG